MNASAGAPTEFLRLTPRNMGLDRLNHETSLNNLFLQCLIRLPRPNILDRSAVSIIIRRRDFRQGLKQNVDPSINSVVSYENCSGGEQRYGHSLPGQASRRFERQPILGGHIRTLNKNVTPNQLNATRFWKTGARISAFNFLALMQELVELEPVDIGSALF